MRVIEPHIHMIARTTADYERMALMHTVACCEPAFWAGYDRTSAQAFYDYFTHLTTFEPKRAEQYLIRHFCYICMNSKESEDLTLSREVISFIPEFLARDNAIGIGEIGTNKNTRNEMTIFEEQVDLAIRLGQLLWIHTPHLNDKLKGTRMMLDALRNRQDLNPSLVCFDHVEEHTVEMVLAAGYWASMTIYPVTKNSPARVVDTIERYPAAPLMVDASGDWGPSDPGTLHQAIFEMRRRGHSDQEVEKIFFGNPHAFLSQSPKFRL
ncbi:MAG: metal-dependent hydrolase [Lentisphaerae bacterium]|nr:metal-dependent hydrolase [Lentisphaerota bacterium]